MKLPCRKCGKPTFYDGVALFGSDTVCKHCGCNKPHRMRFHPIFPFFVYLLGSLAFVLINPFRWSDDAMFFAFSGCFVLMFWYKVFGQPFFIYLAHRKEKPKEDGDADQKLPKSWFWLSGFFLLWGSLSLLLFLNKVGAFEEVAVGDYVFPLKGNEVMDGIDAVPPSPAGGAKTEIRFLNRMDFAVQVFWIDQNGTMRYKMRLPPNFGEKSEAFVGQTWLVTDSKKKPLYFYLAEDRSSDGAIGRARVPPENLVPDGVVD